MTLRLRPPQPSRAPSLAVPQRYRTRRGAGEAVGADRVADPDRSDVHTEGAAPRDSAGTRRVEGSTREEAVRHFEPRIRQLARRIGGRSRNGACLEVDDLVAVGTIGLLEAWERFSPARGLPFAAFAEFRVRGAMLDALRGGDTFSRRRRQLARRIAQTTDGLRAELGRDPAAAEVAARLGLDLADYQRAVSGTAPVVVLSFDATGIDDEPAAGELVAEPTPGAEQVLLARADLVALEQAVATLPDRQRQAVVLYYTEELSLAEIGEVFGVSVSRVSQILTEARARLVARLSAAGALDRAA